MILISWSHSWCFDKAFWFFTVINNSSKSLYSLEIDNLITKSLLTSAHLLHSIFTLRLFFNFSHVFSAVIAKTFTPSDEYKTEYNLVKLLLLTKYISFSAQSIIELTVWSHDMFRTMSLSDCSVMSNWIFSQYQSNYISVRMISWFTHLSLCFIKVSLNLWSLKGSFFTCIQIAYFTANSEFMKFSVQSLSINSQADWLLTLTQTQKLFVSSAAVYIHVFSLLRGLSLDVFRDLRSEEPSSFLN